MLLTKRAIMNLAKTLINDVTIEDYQLVNILEDKISYRPYCIIGPKDEYGKQPKLVIDNVDEWNFKS